jgi:hypothetical protein
MLACALRSTRDVASVPNNKSSSCLMQFAYSASSAAALLLNGTRQDQHKDWLFDRDAS